MRIAAPTTEPMTMSRQKSKTLLVASATTKPPWGTKHSMPWMAASADPTAEPTMMPGRV